MSDDALIETMLDEYIGKIRNTFSGGQHEVCRNKMRAALAVARKAILEEAATVADDIANRLQGVANSQEIQRKPDDSAETWARIRSVEEVANAIRSLAEQEHTP